MTASRSRPPTADSLDLTPHPEGGWYRETWRSPVTFQPPGYDGRRPAATGIYYLLGPGEVSTWHTVRSDELWLWHRGGPLLLTLGGTGERPAPEVLGAPEAPEAREELILGPGIAAGHRPQALVPAGTWQSARPLTAEEVLVSCVVAPGFDFADFTVADDATAAPGTTGTTPPSRRPGTARQ